MKYFLKEIKPFRVWFVVSFLLVALSVVAQLMQPQIMQQLISAIVSGDTDNLTQSALVLVVIAVVGFIAGVINTLIASRVTQQVGANVRKSLFTKIQTFSFQDIEKFQSGNLVVRLVNDTQQAQSLLMMMMQALTRIPIMLVGSIILALITIPSYWWIIVLMIVFVLVTVMISFGIMGPKFGKIQHFIEKINTIAKENFMGMRVVKSFVQEDSEIEKITHVSEKLTKEIIGVGYVFALMMPTFFFVMHGGEALVLYLVSTHTMLDAALVGSAVSFISYMVLVMMALMIGGMMVSFSSRAFVSIRRIEEVMATEPTMLEGTTSERVTLGKVAFKNVTFTYPNAERPTLRNIDFEIEHGKTLGIIGRTGSGKTTLVQLIGRLFDPQEGEVLLQDVALNKYQAKVLHEGVSIVLQRPTLFSGTIGDVMRQGKRDADIDEMQWAAQVAQAYDFIMEYPDTFDAPVYQRGSNFSGGQKQRLSIARGVIKKPKVLVLDDSTSALDARSEKLVQEALRTQLPETTKIIVSQKISSIIHADMILVLERGKIVEKGTHEQLLETSSSYKEIFESQQGKEIIDEMEEA